MNPRLAEIAELLPPGTALDLGCGAGGDALWLAGRGWQVTEVRYPTPREVATELALDSAEWSIERADTPQRQASGPAGRTATVVDHVLVIRRRGADPEGRR
ncbi:class I SAM-dependent methyltransferase [Amycolatopsis taiwanensis]|uniref:class I SAM-dependent methyltransferase n=1 Tax=Amycolatopsis taiwanensis TaxID=342230 RepID=UPI001FE21ACB|nr:hypothetical protein [Amycolatopsis taiwanensis]